MALTKIKLNEVETKADPVLADGVLLSDSADGGRGKISTLTDLQTLIGGGGGGGAVDSVAGKTGVVTLDADDVSPTATKLWFTDTQSAKLTGIAENANNYTHPETHPQSMIEGLGTDLAAKAPLASPALTGTPTAPTAEAGTDTAQLATTAFVQDALAEISIDADPYSVKITGDQSIAGVKTFTSSPVLPTPTAGDNTTKAATTEFVTAAVAGVSGAADAVKLTGDQSVGGIKTFTSSPVLPTPTAGDNTTKAATTAFVTGAVAGVTASSIGLGSVDNTSDINKPVSAAQAAEIAARRPKHTYVSGSTLPTEFTGERGNTYGINTNGYTLILPDINEASPGYVDGYVDGDEICVFFASSAFRTLTITSPVYIVRDGMGRQPFNTPFNISGLGIFITFTKYTSVWVMSYPEYQFGLKAPLASPALAGTPTAPTAATGTNTTQIATTAFVQAALAGDLPLKGTPSELTATEMNTTKLDTDALTGALLMEGTPSGPTATGATGTARFDADYLYVCTATNTWARFPKDGSWT